MNRCKGGTVRRSYNESKVFNFLRKVQSFKRVFVASSLKNDGRFFLLLFCVAYVNDTEFLTSRILDSYYLSVFAYISLALSLSKKSSPGRTFFFLFWLPVFATISARSFCFFLSDSKTEPGSSSISDSENSAEEFSESRVVPLKIEQLEHENKKRITKITLTPFVIFSKERNLNRNKNLDSILEPLPNKDRTIVLKGIFVILIFVNFHYAI